MPRWMAPPHALSRRWKSLAAALLALVVAALAAPSAKAETRFALVIGNGAYRNVPTLNNPPNDAKDIAAALNRWDSRSRSSSTSISPPCSAPSMNSRWSRPTPTCRCSTMPDMAFSSPAATTSSLSALSSARSATSASRTVALDPVLARSSGRETEAISSSSTPAATTPSRAGLPAAGLGSRRQAPRLLHHLRDAARQRRVRRKRPQ